MDANVRPDKVERNISRSDLAMPRGETGQLLAAAFACGLMISLLFLWPTLTIAAILGHGPGRWFYPIMLVVALVLALVLFVVGARDFERHRRWAEEA